VGNPRSNSGHAAEVWLPKELRRQSREEENGNSVLADQVGTDAESVREQTIPEGEQWLLDEPNASSREQTQRVKAAWRAEAPEEVVAAPRKVSESESTLDEHGTGSTTRNEQRVSELGEVVERQARLEAQLAELEDRLKARDAELLGEATRREAELNGRIEELQAALANANQSAGPATKPSLQPAPAKKGKADLNSATFEELRGLGLSVTQCARLISYRDSRQGFDSLDEIDAVPGFPDELRRTLKDQIQLG
jgi:DNA uptake protein ComE-like DNA-binding protein